MGGCNRVNLEKEVDLLIKAAAEGFDGLTSDEYDNILSDYYGKQGDLNKLQAAFRDGLKDQPDLYSLDVAEEIYKKRDTYIKLRTEWLLDNFEKRLDKPKKDPAEECDTWSDESPALLELGGLLMIKGASINQEVSKRGLNILTEATWDVCLASPAIQALGKLDDPWATEILEAILHGANYSSMSEAAEALAENGSEDAIKVFLGVLRGEGGKYANLEQAQVFSAGALARICTKQVLDELIKLEGEVQEAGPYEKIVNAICEFAIRFYIPASLAKLAAEKLEKVALNPRFDINGEKVIRSVEGIIFTERMGKDKEMVDRITAVHLKRIVEQSTGQGMRDAAMRGLFNYAGVPGVTEFQFQIVRDQLSEKKKGTLSSKALAGAVDSLSRYIVGKGEPLSVVAMALKHKEQVVRDSAINGLCNFGGEEAVQYLKQIAKSKRAEDRLALAQALLKSDSSVADGILKLLKKDRDEDVRLAAEKSIKERAQLTSIEK